MRSWWFKVSAPTSSPNVLEVTFFFIPLSSGHVFTHHPKKRSLCIESPGGEFFQTCPFMCPKLSPVYLKPKDDFWNLWEEKRHDKNIQLECSGLLDSSKRQGLAVQLLRKPCLSHILKSWSPQTWPFFWGPRPNSPKNSRKAPVIIHTFSNPTPSFFKQTEMEGIGILISHVTLRKIYFFFTPKNLILFMYTKKELWLFQRFLVQKSGPKKVTRCTNKWTPNKIHTKPPPLLHQVIRCFPKFRRDWEGTFDEEKQKFAVWRRWISGEF